MHHFAMKRGEMVCEGVPLGRIADAVGTPVYVYSHATLSHHYGVFDRVFSGTPHLICYSMKANPNGSIIRTFTNLGSGVDIVSGGELSRALAAGTPPSKIVYSGVGKMEWEIEEALRRGILMFNVESRQELETIDAIARKMRRRAPIALRVNPDVDPKTHPYISTGLKKNKFGIHIDQAIRDYEWAARRRHIEVVGVDCHIGSQLTEISPFVDAAGRVRALVDRLIRKGLDIRFVDIGGGLGITYEDEIPPDPRQYADAIAGGGGEGEEETVLHRRCRDERPCAPFALRLLPRHRPRHETDEEEGGGGRGRAHLRIGRFPREGPGTPRLRGGRPRRGDERRCLRILDVLDIQLAPACRGSDGVRVPVRGGEGAGAATGPDPGGADRVVSLPAGENNVDPGRRERGITGVVGMGGGNLLP